MHTGSNLSVNEATRQQAYAAAWAQLSLHSNCHPVEYVCPISRELMLDPVVASDGHTYDRPQIQRALDRGLLRSPLEGAPLRTRRLTPNKGLAASIRDYRRALDEAMIHAARADARRGACAPPSPPEPDIARTRSDVARCPVPTPAQLHAAMW